MKQITITVLMAFFVALQVFAERVDMREAGVDNQEALKNTEIINNTINRLNKAGGGTLFFPSGDYLTASIHMKSNITLELEAGATLRFRLYAICGNAARRCDDEELPTVDLCNRCREYHYQR